MMDIGRVKTIISTMSAEEKVSLSGCDGTVTRSIERLKISSLKLPRELQPYLNAPSAQLPLGCTFNKELCAKFGYLRSVAAALSGEAFGGVINAAVVRKPFHSFAEFGFGEDPLFVGEMVKSYASKSVLPPISSGLLGEGIFLDRFIDKRCIMENYLFPLKFASAYLGGAVIPSGALNGSMVSENKWFIERVEKLLDNNALILNEYASVLNKSASVNAGGGLELGQTEDNYIRLLRAVKDGVIFEKKLDLQLERLLGAIVENNEFVKSINKLKLTVTDDEVTDAFTGIERESAVLLLNNGVLPLAAFNGVALCGASKENAKAIDNLVQRGANRIRGSFASKRSAASLTKRTVEISSNGGGVIVVIERAKSGLDGHRELITSLKANGVKTIGIIISDTFMEIDFFDKLDACIYLPTSLKLSPQVISEILLGKCDPSGRLPMTWAAKESDYPYALLDICAERDMYCYESLFCSYKYRHQFGGNAPAFPFGHGLSYAKFEYSKLKLSFEDGALKVEFVIKNVGDFAGYAVPQIYAVTSSDRVFGINKKLIAFDKVKLEKTENKLLKFEIDYGVFEVYDEREESFAVMGGKYEIRVCESAEDVKLSANIKTPFPTRVNAGLTSSDVPSYFKEGAFGASALEVEKLVGAPLVMRETTTYLRTKRAPKDKFVRGFVKKAVKAASIEDKAAVEKWANNTAVASIVKLIK